jgi:hypothetical protein
MFALLRFVLAVLACAIQVESRLEAENVALRHQLIVLRRKVRNRPRLTNSDRWFFIQLYRWFPSILQVLTIKTDPMIGMIYSRRAALRTR